MYKLKNQQRLVLLATLFLCKLPAVFAATATTTFPVTATVLSGCAVTANPLSFGNYDPLSTVVAQANTTITAICTVGTPYNVGLNAGAASGATVNNRRMTSGSNIINYTLYSDAAAATIWGNTPGTNTKSGVGNGLSQELTVYGRILTNTAVAPGSYADTVTATITY